MKKQLLALISFMTMSLIGCKNNSVVIKDTLENVDGENAHIVLLYGQSNADGVSHNEYLLRNDPAKYEEYSAGYENVYINFVNDKKGNTSDYAFRKCTLGCGYTDSCFGPEVGIAEKMSLAHPNETTFIIKWTVGGTILKTEWLNGHKKRGSLYKFSMEFTSQCLKYLVSKGYELSLDGICWMQGESDSMASTPSRYYEDTVAYVNFLRNDLKKYQKEIKFVDAGINEVEGIWVVPDEINNVKKRFASESELNYYIDTKEMGLSSIHEPDGQADVAHWDSLSMVKLGQAFGDIVRGK